MSGLVVSDLAGMRTKVKEWADRGDLADSTIDDFINITLQRLNKALRIPATEVTATIAFVSDNMPLPADYLNAKQLTVSTSGQICKVERKELGYVQEQSTRITGGTPLYFGREGTDLVLPLHHQV